ncbi:L-aspartate oxidase [Phenylobacterium montanum]|uniref:L-aspartate oxidase n=1 Tax=Phenylobacterium montanum TaxID=2823693 RepID=A0A975IWC7_9CAUL|nr:L-aspartate oxidase [Caulobacter sp. S6]QUD89942.1 L-aspartate oxidase [Caulobacter sp. S6]
MVEHETFDGVLIVGAGLAGLSAALAAAPRKALVLSAAPLLQGCSSAWAQGGMAAALSADDAPDLHAADTVAAGAGLVDPAVAELLTREGPAAVRRLAEYGAPFDRDAEGRFAQSLEAAHSRPRVARVKGDQAGRAIMEAVCAKALAEPHIEVRPEARVRALLTDAEGRVRGVLAEVGGRLIQITASATVLATGGLGGLYAVTTNPVAVRGEGLALAALAGAQIADPEFVQFHPTAIAIHADPAPLATEALRGEGAVLVDAEGRPFMAAYHPMADLAPRDVVARAIHRQIAEDKGAFLDARQAIGAHFPDEFPAVFAACMGGGIDPREQPIPVAPAVHYHMGGVVTDTAGRTSLEGLYAAGECASTGVHGANRLASNSLLEAAVFGTRAGQAAREVAGPRTSPLAARPAPDLPPMALRRLREAMSRDAGVVRDAEGLGGLIGLIDDLESRHGAALPLVTARLVAEQALARQESRGAHFRADFPNAAAEPRRTFLTLASGSAAGEAA